GDGVASLVALPLGGDEAERFTNGVLIVTRSVAEAFEPDDLAALETFAGQAALSLSHADLFTDALERERLSRELSLAREVQQRLFPQSLPEIDGLEMAAAERPAREVGGDYYDAVRLGDHCVGVIVADVSGKGAGAAFYMAELKGVFQAGSRLTRAPGQLLEGANNALSPSLGRGVFVSAAYAVLDAEAGTVSLARAGHTPAILVRDRERADGGRWLLRGDGLAIGLDRRGSIFRKTMVEQTINLAPGDTLLLYTDGLVEARDTGGEEYGYERLAAFVETWAHTGALEVRDRLLAEHRAWSGSADPDDDTTFVVLHWSGRDTDPAPADISAGPPLTERPAFSS
ncbi:PP2C family protein-serine/threonine phosphatase, partial [Rubrivirga sp.]|uniref:PP2C family protein-serine/threonine phosphatase n=1 Tax=Rubrivirga sp. TaxID=1885344 RepID=UPI003C73B2F6